MITKVSNEGRKKWKITLLHFQTSLLFIINITVIFIASSTHTSDCKQYSNTKNVEINIVPYYCAFQYLVNIWYYDVRMFCEHCPLFTLLVSTPGTFLHHITSLSQTFGTTSTLVVIDTTLLRQCLLTITSHNSRCYCTEEDGSTVCHM
jgi:hypothetical protein